MGGAGRWYGTSPPTVQIKYMLLLNREAKLRLARFWAPLGSKERQQTIREVSALVLDRTPQQCSFLDYKQDRIVYKRYASLYFVAGIDGEENELLTLEVIHRFVETLDR